jgi:hypothetical protein
VTEAVVYLHDDTVRALPLPPGWGFPGLVGRWLIRALTREVERNSPHEHI